MRICCGGRVGAVEGHAVHEWTSNLSASRAGPHERRGVCLVY